MRERRQSCSPNTGFTCNLIEIDELLNGDSRHGPLMFRVAQHLPHDKETPILKLIRNADSRNIIRPHFSFLNSDGIFVIRPSRGHDNDSTSVLYIWKGQNASEVALKAAISLTEMMLGVFSEATNIKIVMEGSEGDEFKDNVEPNTTHTIIDYDDLYEPTAETVERQFAVATSTSTIGWMNELQKQIPTNLHVDEAISGKFLQGADQFKTDPAFIFTIIPPFTSSPSKSKLKMPEFKMNTAKVTPVSTPSKPTLSTPGKEDDLSTPTAVSSPIPTLTFQDTTTHSAGSNVVQNRTNDLDREQEQEQKDGAFDLSILTPLNPIKEKVTVVDLQIATENTREQNLAGPDTAIVVVASPKKDISRIKPALFQCVASPDTSLMWQHMGIYDDDDLLDDSLLLLLCPNAPHHVWKGSAYEINHLAIVNSVSHFEEVGEESKKDKNKENDNESEEVGDEDMKNILRFARKVVDVGDVPLSSEELQKVLSSLDNVNVHMEGGESEDWWDAFNNGM